MAAWACAWEPSDIAAPPAATVIMKVRREEFMVVFLVGTEPGLKIKARHRGPVCPARSIPVAGPRQSRAMPFRPVTVQMTVRQCRETDLRDAEPGETRCQVSRQRSTSSAVAGAFMALG